MSGSSSDLLGHVPERTAVARQRRAVHANLARVGALQPEDGSQQCRLADAVRADQPGELAWRTSKLTSSRIFRPENETLTWSTSRTGDVAHSFCVDLPDATAAWIAATSASIHVW